jgi:hypothetical protein
MWSFVGNKGNKQWVWLAMDVNTGEIVGVFVGDRASCWSYGIMAIVAWGISPMCGLRLLIFGRHMSKSFPNQDIKPLVKAAAEPIQLSDLTVPLAKEFHPEFEIPCPSQRN